MKWLLIISLIILSPYFAQADEALLGKWVDKSYPEKYQFEFSKNNDFTFTSVVSNKNLVVKDLKASYVTKTKTNRYNGVWETGDWVITKGDGSKSSCSLTIYVGSDECCFEYKFIGNNLILTNKYSANKHSWKCVNRVLVRPNEK